MKQNNIYCNIYFKIMALCIAQIGWWNDSRMAFGSIKNLGRLISGQMTQNNVTTLMIRYPTEAWVQRPSGVVVTGWRASPYVWLQICSMKVENVFLEWMYVLNLNHYMTPCVCWPLVRAPLFCRTMAHNKVSDESLRFFVSKIVVVANVWISCQMEACAVKTFCRPISYFGAVS